MAHNGGRPGKLRFARAAPAAIRGYAMKPITAFPRFVVGAMVALGLALATAQAAIDAAGSERAGAFMTSLAQKVIATLSATNMTHEQREEKFHALLNDAFDLEQIGKFVVGRHYQKMTPEQRAEYHKLFGAFLIKTYARRLGGYSGEQFVIVGVRPGDESDVMVRSRIERPGAPVLDCDWKLRLADGNFRIVDLVVEGVSMSMAQRQDFAAVVQGSGIEGLMAALRARVERLPATASR